MKNNSTTVDWTLDSWQAFKISQQPVWPDQRIYENTVNQLSKLPALVYAGESRALKSQLADVIEGKAFVLQAGDCAEEFARCSGPAIHDQLKVILRMAIILAYAGEKKIIKIGRIAGQYAKPRSSDIEVVGGVEIPSYRGDMVNSPVPSLEERMPDPRRMLEGYFRAAATLNLVRAFTHGGYAALDKVKKWSETSFGSFPANSKYDELARGIRKAINFITALGIDTKLPYLNETTVYTSHEALLLGYEEAMTRVDTTTGRWYDTSAHLLWIGERTRDVDGAHVEFLRGVNNPIGVKIGPDHDIDNIKRLIEKLNPENEAGRLTFITRFGSSKISSVFPQLLKEINREGSKVVWICDPMHGNTYTNQYAHKTRKFDDIHSEIKSFWEIHNVEGTIGGGIHLELTGEDVTECIGGSQNLVDADLHRNYQSNIDPRLNAEQAVELAFNLADILRQYNPSDN